MPSQFLVPYITKKVNSYSLVLGQQALIALQIQSFHESISIYLVIDKNIFNLKLFLQLFQKIQIR